MTVGSAPRGNHGRKSERWGVAAAWGQLDTNRSRADVPDGIGLLIHVRATLDGSSRPAQELYAKFVQGYAEQLASESARQEASARAPGARTTEITESVVIRARESLDQETAKRQA
jgi:hypothetical protein